MFKEHLARIAQLVEHLPCKQEVIGSIPIAGSMNKLWQRLALLPNTVGLILYGVILGGLALIYNSLERQTLNCEAAIKWIQTKGVAK